ncbi:MAG: pilus (MSHA type) biogenesis protein MshL [Thiohalorhabdus sp.]
MSPRIFILFLAAALVAGCATSQPTRDQPDDPSGPEGSQADAEDQESSRDRASSPEPDREPASDRSQDSGREDRNAQEDERFDVSAREAPIREVLLGLVDDTDYSVVIDPEVSGEVSLDLREVTVPEVLDFLARSYGYGVERVGQRFLVRPADFQTRTFRVNYLTMDRSGSSQTRVSSGQVTQSGGDRSGQTDNGGERVKGSRIETDSEEDFWEQLQEGLEAILADSPGDENRLVMHPGSGVVLVRAMPGTLREVGEYLEAVEGGAHRQVVIEAKILEVSLDDSFESGINWATLGRAGEAEIATRMAPSEDGGATVGEALVEGGEGQGLLPQLQGLETEGVFSAAVAMDNFSSVLSLLETQGDVNVLSSPRVATVNNQKAVIKVGQDEFFLTDVELRDTFTSAGNRQNFDVDLDPFFNGIALDVTPQVSGEGMVTLHVHPSVTEVTSQEKEFSLGEDRVFRAPLARSDVRESDSVVRARDGEIVVIGGLMSESSTENQNKVPVLGDIPLLGALFRHEETVKTKRELVILLRPRVVYGTPQDGDRRDDLRRMWEGGMEQEPRQ